MSTILSALFPATRRALLVAFFRQPDKRFYLRELIRLAGKGQGSVQRELSHLVQAGILIRQDSQGRSYFFVDPSCPIFAELRSMILKTEGLVDVIRDALAPLSGIRVVFLHGSVAKGTERSDSDVDLVIIGAVTFKEVVRAIGPAQKQLGREINPVLYPQKEFGQKVQEKHHFITTLLDSPKIFIIGSDYELRKMAS